MSSGNSRCRSRFRTSANNCICRYSLLTTVSLWAGPGERGGRLILMLYLQSKRTTYSFVVGWGGTMKPLSPSHLGVPTRLCFYPGPLCPGEITALRLGSVSIKILHQLPRLPLLTSQISMGSQLPGSSKACGRRELNLCTDFARLPILRGGSGLSGYPGRWSHSPLKLQHLKFRCSD